jgi:hypothetical protein
MLQVAVSFGVLRVYELGHNPMACTGMDLCCGYRQHAALFFFCAQQGLSLEIAVLLGYVYRHVHTRCDAYGVLSQEEK